MYYLSYLRTLTNQLPAFSFRSIFEKYPSDDPIFNTLEYDIDIPSLGNKKETKEEKYKNDKDDVNIVQGIHFVNVFKFGFNIESQIPFVKSNDANSIPVQTDSVKNDLTLNSFSSK